MKNIQKLPALFFCSCVAISTVFAASAQTTNSLPGRTLVKLLPDYLRPRIYALNGATTTSNGSLLALNQTNGATLNEISLGINPTDMAISPTADALYIIQAGSRSIIKVNLDTFAVASEKTILTPNTYSTANALHLAVGSSNLVYFTDGRMGAGHHDF
jgi:DNA-binding beta-propeller fold protein YncE